MLKFIGFLTRKEESFRKDLCVLMVLFGAAFFQFLGRLPLLEPDEARYAEIPREMLERSDFITPFLNYVKYFEKPPLLYWLNSISFSLFGQNGFAARFFPALSGLLCVLLTYFIGRKLFGRREGFLAAMVLGTSVGFVAQARMNIIDMPLTLCMSATLGFFLLAVQEGEKRSGLYFHLFYLFSALTVLAKGLIGLVLPGAVIFLYIVLARQWRIVREMRLATGIPLFLLVAAPWFFLVSARNPEFPRFFFIHEHFQRFLTKIHGHYQPPWFFIPVLLGCMFPWSLFLPLPFLQRQRAKTASSHSVTLFLGLWAVVIFAFFSLSGSKLMPYILPMFPAVSLFVGRSISKTLEERDHTGLVLYLAPVLSIAMGLAAFLYFMLARKSQLELLTVSIIGSLLVAGGGTALVCLRKKGPAEFIAVLCGMSFLLTVAGPPLVFGKLAARKTTPELADLINQMYRDGDRISCYGWYQQGIPFYTGKRVIIVGYKGELEFGSNQGNNSAWFIDNAEFVRLWDAPARMFTLIKAPDLARLRSETGTPIRILGQKGNMFLISNR